ncbi:MAG: hypothetical protein IID16_11610 [Candidatus Marinimicrobia bacterium]|nr:hypothetical protein [Candidatus Neomarinimicrobiota bacterium]
MYLIDNNFENDDVGFEIIDFEEPDSQKKSGKRTRNREPECNSDLDCMEDFFTEDYCFFGIVYRNFHDFSCDNECDENVNRELLEVCELGCSEGECIDSFDFKCTENFNCGINDFFGGTFCQDENVYQNYKIWTCENPGGDNSKCSFVNEVKLANECNENLICSEGICVEEL